MRRLTALFILFCLHHGTHAQQKTADSMEARMQWFADAKLGIFIHWGIYAVEGVDESWSFHNRKMGWREYMSQLGGFTASRYDPEAWASLISESGARYAVLTAKHHDGVAIWDTREDHYSVKKNTPAGRDLFGPFFAALRKRQLKAGAYFSLIDWSHPDYPGFLKDSSRYAIQADPGRWQRFLRFYQAQITEISQRYTPDLWWFDGDWEHSPSEWQAAEVRRKILGNKPGAIINGRLQGYGDYTTPEQNFPVRRPADKWWELCMTINNNWGYQPADTNWKTPYQVITIFADVVSNGGNLLLDIGPRADGTIPEQQVRVLKELGAWNRKHEAAIFGTRPGLPAGHFYGPSTISKDSTSLYLFLPGRVSGDVVVKGLMNPIERISVAGTGQALTHKVVGKISWSKVPGLVYIQVPESALDRYMTVLRVELKGPLKLYAGSGGL
jgi:alpha-L-fucosidase